MENFFEINHCRKGVTNLIRIGSGSQRSKSSTSEFLHKIHEHYKGESRASFRYKYLSEILLPEEK